MDKIYIWGAGKVGKSAVMHYKENREIIGIIDSNKNKWGREYEGYPIVGPECAKRQDIDIVVAVRQYEPIVDQLKAMDIKSFTVFDMREYEYRISEQENKLNSAVDSIIVFFGGGLGNQMFHYAMYRNQEILGRSVYAEMQDDILVNVFPELNIQKCSRLEADEYLDERIRSDRTGRMTIYREPHVYECSVKEADESLLNVQCGYLKGIFQSAYWPKMVEDDLRKSFIFQNKSDDGLIQISNEIRNNKKSVSMHIRRGDYLDEMNVAYYDNICTDQYYETAVGYMENEIPGCHFYVFSNEPAWVRENNRVSNATIISAEMFDDYEDWYDMYLMSLCANNIIANSTFSWWGAWLNQNKNKTVIAPKKWINGCEYKDIYPNNWIIIG